MFKARQNKLEVIVLLSYLFYNGVLAAPSDYQNNRRVGDTPSYDFIIVGGGVAGSVLARRLSDNGKYSVMLLELGGFPTSALDIPGTFREYLINERPDFVKIYETVPQTNAGLLRNGQVAYPVGRVLGGGSSVNGMALNRGSPYDYDNWARISGDQSWNYASMMKYFIKVENYTAEFPSEQHGYSGPVVVSRPRFSPGLNFWLDAGAYLGYPVAGPSGPQRISFATMEYAKRFGRRVSSYNAYLKPVLTSRINLKVITHVRVQRILFEGSRAVGVLYSNANQTTTSSTSRALALKEVIISAGVIDSPALLMRSGIGPKDVLHAAKIPVVKYLPVGLNLHDRVTTKLDFIITNTSAAFVPERDLTLENFQLFNQIGDGPFANFDGAYGQAYLMSRVNTQRNPEWSDIHLIFLQRTITNPLIPEVLAATGKSEAIVSCGMLLGRPRSRGRVTLNVTDIDADPLVDFQYLTHPEDMEIMVEGLKTILKIYEETPLKHQLGARYPIVPLLPCKHLPFRSDDYWRCYIRQLAVSPPHGSGSIKMASDSDPSAVVNSKLRVISFENLRVIDSSIMPNVVNTNTQGATYFIAEKGSDMILEHWENHERRQANRGIGGKRLERRKAVKDW